MPHETQFHKVTLGSITLKAYLPVHYVLHYLLMPTFSVQFPALQSLPTGHVRQAAAPAVGWKNPVGQGKHGTSPVSDASCGGHSSAEEEEEETALVNYGFAPSSTIGLLQGG